MNPLLILPIVLISFIVGYGVSRVIAVTRHHSGYIALGFDPEENTALYQLHLTKHPSKVAKLRYILLDVEIAEWIREKNTSLYEETQNNKF